MKRRPTFLVIALLGLLCAATFLFRDTIAKLYLQHYLRSRIGEQCAVERVRVWYDTIAVEGIHLEHEYFLLDLARLNIDFSFPEFVKPRLGHIALSGADITIHSMEKTQGLLKELLGEPRAVITVEPPAEKQEAAVFSLALDAVTVAIKDGDGYLTTAFSFAGVVSPRRLLELKRLRVDSFKLRSGAVSCAFRIEQEADSRYTLHIDSIKRQDKEIKDIILPFEMVEDDIIISESPLVFLGPATSIRGRFELFGFDRFCFQAFLHTASFTNVVQFFGQERNILFNGSFNGELRFCWEKNDFSDISALFSSAEAGTINVRKEVSFDFLKKYLDEKSQKALVDSFNNYSYNNGTLAVTKEGDTVSIHFDFDSELRGRRNVLINVHMGQ